MELKSGYKKTEVGVIPEEWEVNSLVSLSEKIMVGIASAATHAYRDKGIVLLRNQNIKAGFLDDSDVLFVDPAYESVFKNKRLKYGDLLTARTGYPGATCVVPDKYHSAQSFTTLITRPNSKTVDSLYLCYYINSEHGQMFFEQSQIGGAQKNVNAGSLKTMPIPLPAIPEQRAIAAALSDVDALIASLDRMIAKKRNMKQATMQELLTGKRRLPGFSGEWEVKRLGEVAQLKNGYTFRSSTYTATGKYKIITIASVQDGFLTTDGCALIEDLPSDIQTHQKLSLGNFLISMTGNVGRICKVEEVDCLLNQRVGKIVPSEGINSEFIFHLIRQKSFLQAMMLKAKGGAQGNLSVSDILDHLFHFPQDHEEQTAIATILSDMDADIATMEQKLDKTRMLKQGMMQELLTGRIRLI
ncbi:MAG: restriction endonuclease subunit S [Geobacteraceae bacterium]